MRLKRSVVLVTRTASREMAWAAIIVSWMPIGVGRRRSVRERVPRAKARMFLCP